MYSFVMLFALSSFVSPADIGEQIAWQTDYAQAQKEGETAKKPLAVFIGSGKTGWDKVGRGSGISTEARQLLASKYVSVYVDTTTASGKKLAASFEIGDGPGLVISDRTGQLQAFRHEGDLANADLSRYLDRFADPAYNVRTTETNPSRERASYYGPGGTATPAPVFHGMQPGYCPTCSGCAGGRCPR